MNGREAVWERVEAFRSQYLTGTLAHLPVDVFTLAELELMLDIVPFDDLFEKYDADAALMHDFTGIYVDAEAYILWEKGPRWKQRRLRFSVAHELGHYILHRDIAAKVTFKSLEEFAAWTKGYHGQQYTLEQAANEFAGGCWCRPRVCSRSSMPSRNVFPSYCLTGRGSLISVTPSRR